MSQKTKSRSRKAQPVQPEQGIPKAGYDFGEAIRKQKTSRYKRVPLQVQKKRSENIKKIVGYGVLGGVFAIAAWPEPETGIVLSSVEDCKTPLKVSRDVCEAAHATALMEHERLAPRFYSESQCREQFGQCTQLEGFGTLWSPAMAGFLVGYSERDDEDEASSGGGSGGGLYRFNGSLPLYRERGGDFLNPKGDYVRTGWGKVQGSAGSTVAPTRAISISRSGFGSGMSARSSFGG